MKIFTLHIILFFLLSACSQEKQNRLYLGKKSAEREVIETLENKGHNVINNALPVIKDSVTAVAIAEPILFNIYGKENILEQKPYEIYHIDNFWFIRGTLKKHYSGGTFIIIIDDRNSKILKISHGK